MAISANTLNLSQFNSDKNSLSEILIGMEGFETDHLDHKGIPTEGYGYALLVKTTTGWAIKSTWLVDFANAGVRLTNTQISQTENALNEIAREFNNNLGREPSLSEATTIRNQYLNDPTSSAFDFTLTSEQAKALLNIELDRSIAAVRNLYPGLPADSTEILALASLYYNLPALVNSSGAPSLFNAITHGTTAGDRARAWFEIRYNSNLNNEGGVAKRRFFESQLFGLYADPSNVTKAEAESIIAFLNQSFNGTTFLQNLLAKEQSHWQQAGNAVRDYHLTDSGHESLYIQDIFKPIAAHLIDHYLTDENTGVSGANFVIDGDVVLGFLGANHILDSRGAGNYVGADGTRFEDKNDLLIAVNDGENILNGHAGNDVLIGADGDDRLNGGVGADYLFGKGGNDTLTGGKDRDYLFGGSGADTYVWNDGDGNDQIVEMADGSINKLLINGVDISTLQLTRIDGSESWLVADNATGVFAISRSSGHVNLSIRQADGGFAVITIKNHQDGDFGLNLNANYDTLEDSIRQTPITDAQGYLVVGDGVFGANDPYLSAKYSQRGELYNDRDMLFDAQKYFTNEDYYPLTSGSRGYLRNYAFEGGKGNDILEGSDWRAVQAAALAAGARDDFVQSFVHPDGSSHYYGDMINGMEGNDIIYGDKPGQIGDADYLVGGHGSDMLFGGGGHDILFGLGTFPQNVTGPENISNFEQEGDSDYLDGGDGDDFLFAGSYNDTLLGGEGRDRLFAGAGQDILLGGQGDDELFGDSAYYRIGTSFWGNFITPDIAVMGAGGDYYLLDRFDVATDFNDTILGGDGNDKILGEIGADRLFGGAGDDIIQGDRTNSGASSWSQAADYYKPLPYWYNGQIYHGDDYIDGGAGNDFIDGNGGNDLIFAGLGEDVVRGDDDVLDGQFHGNDTIYGEGGNDHLEGSGGHDFIDGGEGDDVIMGDWMRRGAASIGGAEDQVIPLAAEYHGNDELHGGAGDDRIYGNGGHDLIYGGEGDDRLYGDDDELALMHHGNDTIFGGAGNDWIYGNGGHDVLYGDEGDDVVWAGDGDDVAYGGVGNDQLLGGAGDDRLYGDAGNDVLWGNEGDDILYGGAGNDQLSGGTGTDWLYGGAGNDVYVYAAGDGITYIDDESGLDSLVLQGISSRSISLGLGSLLIRTGQAGDEIHILGFDGADLSSISVEYFYFSDGAFTGQQLVQQYGFQLDSPNDQGQIWGTSFHDRIVLSPLASYANGGGGDDSYVVSRNSLSHVCIQDESGRNTLALEGFTERSEVQFSLEQNDLLLSFTREDGEQASVLIQRNEGGRFAVDTLSLANETLNVSDLAAQLANAQNVAPLLRDDYAQLLAPAGSVQGNVLANDHDDDGDALSVVNSGTQVGQFGRLELSANGAYSYHANEALLATLAAGESVTDVFSYQASDGLHSGNAQLAIGLVGVNDAPVVNRGMDKQSGTAGEAFSFVVADDAFLDVDNDDHLTLSAGLSNGAALPGWLSFDAASQTFRSFAQAEAGEYDIQVTATDLAGAHTSTTFTLTVHPAVVPEGVHLKGSIFNDTLVGTDYDDVLDGGLGADTMKGGKGNDLYYVDYQGLMTIKGDRIMEQADEGYDSVKSSVSYTLPDNVEALQLLDNLLATVATGNNLDNLVQGNRYANTLYGLVGDDVLVGGKGNDKLHGGTGNDTYVFARGDGNDTIYNDETSYAAVDILQFADVNYESLWLTRKGSDLLVDVLGGGGQVKVANWYGDSRAQMDYIQTANGTLEASSVDQLVAAMATFKMPKGSGMEIPQDVRQQLDTVLSASWG